MPLRDQPADVQDRAARLAVALNVPIQWIDAVITRESRWNPALKSPRSSASGLLQWTTTGAKALGTTPEQIRQMSAVDQLDLAERWWIGRDLKRPVDLWISLLRPASVGAPMGSVLYRRGEPGYTGNRELDLDGDGLLTVRNLADALKAGAARDGITLAGVTLPRGSRSSSAALALGGLGLGALALKATTGGLFDACATDDAGKAVSLESWQADPRNRAPLWPNEWQTWIVAIRSEGLSRAEAVFAARQWVAAGIFHGPFDLDQPFGDLGHVDSASAEWIADVDTSKGPQFWPAEASQGVKTWQSLSSLPTFSPGVWSVVRVRFVYRGTLRDSPWPFCGDNYWGRRDGCPIQAHRALLAVQHDPAKASVDVPKEEDPQVKWDELGEVLTLQRVPLFLWLLLAVLGVRAVRDLTR